MCEKIAATGSIRGNTTSIISLFTNTNGSSESGVEVCLYQSESGVEMCLYQSSMEVCLYQSGVEVCLYQRLSNTVMYYCMKRTNVFNKDVLYTEVPLAERWTVVTYSMSKLTSEK